MLPRTSALAIASLILASALPAAWTPDPELMRASTERWGDDIAALEALDKAEHHPDDSILFVGSSSIRLWNTIVEDTAPYHPIQRGYGGARFSDVAVFAERLIRPHRFRALVVFVGNDVSGSPEDATPQQVITWFRHICAVAREHQPDAEIFCIEITPTQRRWDVWPRIDAVNRALAAECAAEAGLHFIPTANAYIGADGRPDLEFFREDHLHLSRLGYHMWSAIITSHLDAVFRIGGQ